MCMHSNKKGKLLSRVWKTCKLTHRNWSGNSFAKLNYHSCTVHTEFWTFEGSCSDEHLAITTRGPCGKFCCVRSTVVCLRSSYRESNENMSSAMLHVGVLYGRHSLNSFVTFEAFLRKFWRFYDFKCLAMLTFWPSRYVCLFSTFVSFIFLVISASSHKKRNQICVIRALKQNILQLYFYCTEHLAGLKSCA